MASITLDRSHLDNEALAKLAQNTNLTHLSFGSKSRILNDILNEKLELQLAVFEENIDKTFLRGATGNLLDYFGEVYGLDRPQAQKAQVLDEEKNFNFYTLELNFGAINNGNDIIVPAGRQIFNEEEIGDDTTIYTLTEDITLPVDETRVFFSAKSLDFGETVNAGENTLNYHNFTNYADVLNDTLFVTNSSSIVYGSDEMDDENYRFLIQQQPLASERANFTALENNLRRIPGIANFKRILYLRGIGTADWIIKSTTPTVSDALLDLAQTALDDYKADGLDHMAVAPTTVGLQLFFSITYKKKLETKEKNRIKTVIRRNLTDYVNNLEIGEKLVLDQLTNIILNSSENVESIGTPNEKFDKIVIFKYSNITNSRIKKILFADYKTAGQERVIIEPGVELPISIFENN